MRIISGSARGKKLLAPEGEFTRPTADMVKQAIFNIIQFEIKSKYVLDLFGGSGQLAIEALSRGAENAVIVDCRKDSIDVIKKNTASAGFSKNAEILLCDAFEFLKNYNGKQFDIILLDPPYSNGMLKKCLSLINQHNILSKCGIIVCESLRDEIFIPQEMPLKIRRENTYGIKKITVLETEGA